LSVANRAKGLAKCIARRFGYEIARVEERATMASALMRLASRHGVRTIIDVGASDGRWSGMARRSFPDAAFLLFEAQEGPHGEALRRLSAGDPRFHVVIAAAGGRPGTIHFDASDAWSGVASEEPTGAGDIIVPVTTVDLEIERLGLDPPFLLKLDTHGFEMPILEGAARTLDGASALIIEAYNFQLRRDSLRFHELCAYLEERGFGVVDLVDLMWRPGDGVLWQFDLVFVRSDAPELASNAYG
jgi:FkbM family methyltransferase